ncbi:hypothetical protein MPAR168_22750 [Methylorubrum populi]|uniref:Uncharacterized protein n=1 Tax=Methylobacterium radiotolerans TaxID=31998 RepID=A0ABU7TGJ2_9HYPH|nr:MAG: hypothetical protein COT56_14735 [Methylobacterium sp. CG09_land_8_20_14_0_10_71_15]PIU12965.1 MAG: hypothetical protein COT28_12825 [Methylobacterium sp. CG08_land_8_20_14_0_20_71_15]GBU15901.1 hypothetical protein AwMethylo_01160 [Methylobacterium sp.]
MAAADGQADADYQVIVPAPRLEAAETAIRASPDRRGGGTTTSFELARAWASPDYLRATVHKPGEVRGHEP